MPLLANARPGRVSDDPGREMIPVEILQGRPLADCQERVAVVEVVLGLLAGGVLGQEPAPGKEIDGRNPVGLFLHPEVNTVLPTLPVSIRKPNYMTIVECKAELGDNQSQSPNPPTS